MAAAPSLQGTSRLRMCWLKDTSRESRLQEPSSEVSSSTGLPRRILIATHCHNIVEMTRIMRIWVRFVNIQLCHVSVPEGWVLHCEVKMPMQAQPCPLTVAATATSLLVVRKNRKWGCMCMCILQGPSALEGTCIGTQDDAVESQVETASSVN